MKFTLQVSCKLTEGIPLSWGVPAHVVSDVFAGRKSHLAWQSGMSRPLCFRLFRAKFEGQLCEN